MAHSAEKAAITDPIDPAGEDTCPVCLPSGILFFRSVIYFFWIFGMCISVPYVFPILPPPQVPMIWFVAQINREQREALQNEHGLAGSNVSHWGGFLRKEEPTRSSLSYTSQVARTYR